MLANSILIFVIIILYLSVLKYSAIIKKIYMEYYIFDMCIGDYYLDDINDSNDKDKIKIIKMVNGIKDE